MKEFTKVAILVFVTVGVAFITISGYVLTSIEFMAENIFQYILVVLIIGMIPIIIIATKLKPTINNEATE